MATYSVNNIKIDNGLFFTPGPTAGYVLSIDSDGSTTWITPQSGSSGASGSSGTSGANGSSGSSGTSGIGSSGTSGINGAAGATGSSATSPYGAINLPILNQGFKPMIINNLWSNVLTGTALISQAPSIDADAVLIPFRTPVVLGITGIGTQCIIIGSPAPSVRFICYANNNTSTNGFLVNGPTTRIWRTNATSPASSGSFFSATQSYTFQPGTTYWVGYEIIGSGGGTTRLAYIPNSALESTGVDPANLISGVGNVGPQDTTPFSSINYKSTAVLYMEFTGCSASATS